MIRLFRVRVDPSHKPRLLVAFRILQEAGGFKQIMDLQRGCRTTGLQNVHVADPSSRGPYRQDPRDKMTGKATQRVFVRVESVVATFTRVESANSY